LNCDLPEIEIGGSEDVPTLQDKTEDGGSTPWRAGEDGTLYRNRILKPTAGGWATHFEGSDVGVCHPLQLSVRLASNLTYKTQAVILPWHLTSPLFV
ncbi:MAG: hypothetical protein V3T31_12160, partial [candidate division Zixibacteria bacterium]